MIAGSFDGIPDAWEFAVRKILTEGEHNNTEYGDGSMYINGMAIEMRHPELYTWHKKDPYCTKNTVREYLEEFKRGYTARRIAEAKTTRDKELAAFKYTYLDRFVDYDGFDQIDYIVRELKKGRTESRRLQIITWMPKVDAVATNQDPPCLQRMWFYARPGKILDVDINYRSWDIYKGFGANINGILFMVQNEIMDPTGYRLNKFRAWGDNCHIYGKDLAEARQRTGIQA